MRTYWVSAYTLWGTQFGATIEAENVDDLFRIFHEKYEDSDVADYGIWDDVDEEFQE